MIADGQMFRASLNVHISDDQNGGHLTIYRNWDFRASSLTDLVGKIAVLEQACKETFEPEASEADVKLTGNLTDAGS